MEINFGRIQIVQIACGALTSHDPPLDGCREWFMFYGPQPFTLTVIHSLPATMESIHTDSSKPYTW